MIAAIIDMKSQSYLGLSSNCAASRVGLRHRDRQQYGPSHPNIHYRMREVHPGSLFSATRRTVCRESIRFEASPLLYERVGIGSSWTNRRPGLRSRRHDSWAPPKSVSTSRSNNTPPVRAYTIAAAKAGGAGCWDQAQGGFY